MAGKKKEANILQTIEHEKLKAREQFESDAKV